MDDFECVLFRWLSGSWLLDPHNFEQIKKIINFYFFVKITNSTNHLIFMNEFYLLNEMLTFFMKCVILGDQWKYMD